jgi:chemotaxis protein MotB
VSASKEKDVMRSIFLITVCSAALTACVSQGRYDEAIQGANDARAQLVKTAADDETAREKQQALVDEQTTLIQQLSDDITRRNEKAEALDAEKSSLATALNISRAQLDDLRRARAAAEVRARLFHDLALRLKSMVDAGDLSIVLRDGRMVLQLPNDVLFPSGQVDIQPRGRRALEQVATVLDTLPGRRFQVAGHTDNVPIETDRFPSNWELSTARALEVMRFLVAHGVKSGELSAAGYAEFDPVAPNSEAHGRAKNRRIEIVLEPNIDELVAVPDLR